MFITLENVSYHVLVKGTGHPVIGFHGFAENLSTWEFICLNNCQMVLVDLIGHGSSSKPQFLQPYCLPVMIQHIHELVQYLGLNKYSLMGYSMGGRLALAYALAYPEEVRRLILESSSYGECDKVQRAKRLKNDIWLANAIRKNGILWFNRYWSGLDIFASQSQLSQDIRERISTRRLMNAPHALANTLMGSGQGVFPCLKSEIAHLSIPVLYINGEYDSKYQKIGQEFEKLNSRLKREIIAGVGHNTHLENPKVFTDIVNQFINDC
ncbi:MAG: 2-succinyl-6-hydroxy-2,4-cyclohexadiene-1-carboxylate synthase [Bacillota bacterium]|jgi:2-succinyl-6-hydroxy-2,4-cyclohexadiene-1-carboxylate synthase